MSVGDNSGKANATSTVCDVSSKRMTAEWPASPAEVFQLRGCVFDAKPKYVKVRADRDRKRHKEIEILLVM